MIFKLQRALITTEALIPCLIYNEDRSIKHLINMTPELMDLFGEELSIYIDSYIENPTVDTFPLALLVGKIMEEQSW